MGQGAAAGWGGGCRGTASPAPSTSRGTIPCFLQRHRPHCPAETSSGTAHKGLPGFFKDISFSNSLSPTAFNEKCNALTNLHCFIFCCIF